MPEQIVGGISGDPLARGWMQGTLPQWAGALNPPGKRRSRLSGSARTRSPRTAPTIRWPGLRYGRGGAPAAGPENRLCESGGHPRRFCPGTAASLASHCRDSVRS